jgi:urease accessory protein
MLIKEKLGNINNTSIINCDIDKVIIEWYEAGKRILHKQTKSGIDITIKFLKENPDLKDGDILWRDENSIIAVEIKPCKCIVITPNSMLTALSVCYEIGNRHLPLFYEGEDLLVPYEMPLYNLLLASGYELRMEERKLSNALKTTVLPHLQVTGTDSLFTKILQLPTSP